MNFIRVFLKISGLALLMSGALLLTGCDKPKKESWSGGDLRGVNHTAKGINYFVVNHSRGPNIAAYGEGGGACCISLPDKWRPGLKADVQWETYDFDLVMEFPGYVDREKYDAWKEKISSTNVMHHTTVDIPDYGEKKCGLTVHFLACNQIKVTASCKRRYGTADYPIKEPREMEEPEVCPE
ncbi:DUF3304 domain-containing protein [Pantoea anthophila]|uniref:DUF3304 domain-containing protein n=1 Tax=Pantoea anthophila TaxID=470931 RepID=UPI003018BA4A